MPELPEVETVKESLKPNIIGRKITYVEVHLARLIKIPLSQPEHFREMLVNTTFTNIKRRGKYLLFYLDSGFILVIHLRMTGRLLYIASEESIIKHTHFIFRLDNGYDLRFHDVRQFGMLYLVREDELKMISGIESMGPEPLSEEFNLECLETSLKGKKQKVKAFLLDQRCVAGIGNIYADEILFHAGIHPEKTVDKLSGAEKQALLDAVKDRLQASIVNRGTSIKDYVDGFGEAGSFQHQLKVYGKAGQLCSRCGRELEKTIVSSRTTTYCPYCQKYK